MRASLLVNKVFMSSSELRVIKGFLIQGFLIQEFLIESFVIDAQISTMVVLLGRGVGWLRY